MFLNEEQRLTLFEQEKPLAYYVAHTYANPEDKEDVHQEALLALWVATGKYDDERSDKFSTYAFWVIKDYVRAYKQRNRCVVSYPRNRKVDMVSTNIEDNDIPAPHKEIDDALDYEQAIRDLPSHLILIARLKLKGYTIAEIGKKLDLQQSTVLGLVKELRQNLQ